MTDKSKIDKAFEGWLKEFEKEDDTTLDHIRELRIAWSAHKAGVEHGSKQSRIDLAEDIHVALTFAEAKIDKDHALKRIREIIDIELDDEYWNNPK